MALICWLPLTNDLRNQGLNNYSVTIMRGSEVWNNSGKLGKSFYANGINTLQINNIIPDLYNSSGYSLCAWFYIEGQNTTHTGSGIISGGNWNNQVLNLSVSDWSSDHYTRLRVSGSNWNNTYAYNFYKNTWYHAVVCSDGIKTYAYINGVLIGNTVTGFLPSSIEGNNIAIGGATYYSGMQFFGRINDVRIYDHCLSAMEVKQLAQGLVLHYPLNRQSWGQENLVWNTHWDSMPTKWNNWGSPPTREIVEINGKRWLHVKASDRWQGYSQNQSNRNGIGEITPGEQLTLSYWAYGASTYNNYPCIGIHWTDGSNILSQVWPQFNITTSPQKCVVTVTVPTGVSAFNIMIGNGSGTSGNTNEVWIAEAKLERGSIATPWSPNSADALATTLGLNGTTEYDCSGYCNNGEKIGTLTYTSDTPKYAVSTHIDATTTKIHISNLSTSGFGNSYSFAWWAKISSVTPMHWGFSDGIRLNGMYTGRLWNTGDGSNNPLYNIGTTTQVTAPTVNVWHHWVMTGDGTKCYVYQDGELWAEAKTYKSISGTSIYINGWNSTTDYSSNNYSISDFRIYATALSADDVKSLYQNCATIDPDGTIRGQIRS